MNTLPLIRLLHSEEEEEEVERERERERERETRPRLRQLDLLAMLNVARG
jgi:hypothetical protein